MNYLVITLLLNGMENIDDIATGNMDIGDLYESGIKVSYLPYFKISSDPNGIVRYSIEGNG
ncbi:MAG: hypothetical protein K2N15_10900 [Lachnospiraceae bacterium]|nr:hypothetical protein [Lachnospiraceae bacterium]